MAENEPVKEKTVIVDKDGERRPTYGWIWAIVVLVLIIVLFFLFGGMSWFTSSPASSPSTPQNINIQPQSGQ